MNRPRQFISSVNRLKLFVELVDPRVGQHQADLLNLSQLLHIILFGPHPALANLGKNMVICFTTAAAATVAAAVAESIFRFFASLLGAMNVVAIVVVACHNNHISYRRIVSVSQATRSQKRRTHTIANNKILYGVEFECMKQLMLQLECNNSSTHSRDVVGGVLCVSVYTCH